jgi:hypothetical protein
MLRSLKSFFRGARLRVPVFAIAILAFSGCENNETFGPAESVAPTAAAPEGAAVAFAGGIPIGNFNQPLTEFGAIFNGAHENIAPSQMVAELTQIRARGGRVVLSMTGNHLKNYVDGAGHFSMSKWKDRLNRFRGVNFTPFINDGTVIGHYMIDEPNDPANWGGKPVSASEVEEMARYSKQLWPNMATIVRVDPKYLDNNHRYLDAAWSQYLWRRGDANNYIKTMVASAQDKGLQLIVGLNIVHGGNPQGTAMSAKEVETFGSALLSSNYPCAFINWRYTSNYMNSGGIRDAMRSLRRKAESRPTKSCRN